MSFRWQRDGIAITSTCTLCGMATRSLSEAAIHDGQRAHTAVACISWRLLAETPRLEDTWTEPEPDRCPEGHERAGNTHVDKNGCLVCNACRRERYAAHRQEKEAS